MDIERIARRAHEVNRVYCQSIGDYSQSSWDTAPEWQRDSARAGVGAVLRDPSMTPAQTHEMWLAHKEAAGWVYGPEKDADRKTHPCMVPYAELPREQQVKDTLFRCVVLSYGIKPGPVDSRP